MMIHSKDLFLLLEDCGGTCLFWLAKDGVFGYRPTDGDWKGEWGRRWGKENLPRRLSGVSMRNRLNLLSGEKCCGGGYCSCLFLPGRNSKP